MKAKIGTTIVFNVQGARLECEVGQCAESGFQPGADQFFGGVPHGCFGKSAAIPRYCVKSARRGSIGPFPERTGEAFPSVSAIDLTQILRSVDEVLRKVSFVIRFMAMFSILTGLLVLFSSIYQSKFARIRESVLLRTWARVAGRY
jgi:putative ABC transport system permease protein